MTVVAWSMVPGILSFVFVLPRLILPNSELWSAINSLIGLWSLVICIIGLHSCGKVGQLANFGSSAQMSGFCSMLM